MPSHQDNLKTVIDACVAANSSLMCARCPHCGEECGREAVGELCLQCSNGMLYDAVVTPTLPDVLLALGIGYGFLDGEIMRLTWFAGTEYGGYPVAKWEPRFSLSGQTPESVAALAALLKPND